MSKFKSLTIREAVALGSQGTVRLRFKGLTDSFITIKPITAIVSQLSPSRKLLCQLDPTNLVGATLSVEPITNRETGETTEAVIETFKKGDKYIATENNTAVKEGKAKVGDELQCESDGLRIQGGIRIELHPEVEMSIAAEERAQAVKAAMTATVSNRMSAASSRIVDSSKPEDENGGSEDENGGEENGGENPNPEKDVKEGIEGEGK